MLSTTFQKSEPSPSKSLRGYVDRCDSEMVSGWLVDLAKVQEYLSVKILVDDVEACCCVANEYREDLAANPGFAGTYHAYNIKIPNIFRDGNEHEVRVVEAKTGYLLNNSPRMVSFPLKNEFKNNSSRLDLALVGKEGWLFLSNDSNGCIEQYTGNLRLSPQFLQEYVAHYQKKQELFQRKGIYYLLAIAPGKEYIYPEYLPDSVVASNLPSVREQFIAAVNPELNEKIIDLKSILLMSKARGQLCYKNDSHWNYLGAMIASKAIIDKIHCRFPRVSKFNESIFSIIEKDEGAGDLTSKSRLDYFNGKYVQSSKPVDHVASSCAFGVKYDVKTQEIANHPYKDLSKTRPTRLFRNERARHLPRALILRDSYADWMIPFLSEYFSESLFLWARNVDESVITSFKPEIVIEEVVDRFLVTNRIAALVSPPNQTADVKLAASATEKSFMKAHLYGISSYLPDASFLSADELSKQSGENTGNLVFCHAIGRMLDAGPQSNPWGTNLSHLSLDRDRLVVPLANWLGPHVNLSELAEAFRFVHIPVVGVGLGAQGPICGLQIESIPEGSWEWLKFIASKSATEKPNISLRGQTTYDAIASKGLADKCVVTGCPSNFINPSPELGREIINKWKLNGIFRVAVAAGTPSNNLPKLEQSLVSLVEQTNGIYVCQDPIDMLRLSKQEVDKISRQSFLEHKEYIHPTLEDDQFVKWFRRWSHVFTSVPEWLTFMKGFDVVIGTRIHGVMAGIQSGVPSICICTDSRTLELCQTMMIPYVTASQYEFGINISQINEVMEKWDWKAYDENRHMLAERFANFFSDNQLDADGAVGKILKRCKK
jgi:hypothetical protein